ncbi:MAG: hypothetical protein ACTHN5_11520 [Phycisphaerae bacterium]
MESCTLVSAKLCFDVEMVMPAFYEIMWVRKFYEPAEYWYRLGDGGLMEMWTEPVWCERCGRVTAGEDLRSVEFYEEEVRRYERLAGEVREEVGRVEKREAGGEGDRATLEQKREMERRRDWRAGRVSPAKCTECGGAELIFLCAGPATKIAGDEIVVRACGFYEGTGPRVVFDAEGKRVGDERGGSGI